MFVNWAETAILFGTLFVCIIAYIKWTYNFWKYRNIPYIEPRFPGGNFETIWAIKKGLHQEMVDVYKYFKQKGYKHGGVFSYFKPVYIPIDLDIIKNIMINDFQHFVDRGLYYNETKDPLSAHLFAIEGDKWKNLRTRLTPTFTSGKMKSMFPLVLDCADDLEAQIFKLWKAQEPIDIKETGALYTTNVIGTCVFGLECKCFENPDNEFRYYTKKFFAGSFERAFRETIAISFPHICKMLNLRRFDSSITNFYAEVMRKIINHRESSGVSRNDFVQLLLEMKNGKNGKETFTFNEIAAQAFVFFLAGFETSSSTLTYSFYEMAKNHEIQDRVRNEIRETFKKYNGKLTYDAINEMTYMAQLFDETLRKYPIDATVHRICTKDYTIPGENLTLEKGQKILISLKGIQNDPEYFPDPDKFDPERFTPENKATIHPCAYMPFGEGPRICIGLRFGVMQAKIGMATILKDYKFTLNSSTGDLQYDNKARLLAPIGKVLLDIHKAD